MYKLKNSEKNRFFDEIEKQGMDPNLFKWKDQSSPPTYKVQIDYLGNVYGHNPFFFQFEYNKKSIEAPRSNYKFIHSPTSGEMDINTGVKMALSRLLDVFRYWLRSIQEEAQPNKWESLKQSIDLISKGLFTSKVENDALFQVEEQKKIQTGLVVFEKRLITKVESFYSLSLDDALAESRIGEGWELYKDFIKEQIQELKEELAGSSKWSWGHQLKSRIFAIMFNAIVFTLIPKEFLGQIINSVLTYFGEFVMYINEVFHNLPSM